MRELLDIMALGVGYFVLVCIVLLLALFVGTLFVDALKPWRKPTPNAAPVSTTPVVTEPFVGRWVGDASPHPLKHPAVHVDATSDDEAWDAVSRRVS